MDFGNRRAGSPEALVENIFHLAGYRVARIGRESRVGRLVKEGADEFLPDFLAWKRAKGREGDGELHRLVSVEVKYRAEPGGVPAKRCAREVHGRRSSSGRTAVVRLLK